MKALGLIISTILFSSEGLVSLSGCPGGQQVNFPAGLLTLSLARRALGREWQDLTWLSLFTRAPSEAQSHCGSAGLSLRPDNIPLPVRREPWNLGPPGPLSHVHNTIGYQYSMPVLS